MKKAIFPGSFNPLHKGHIAIIKKALEIFDSLIVVVSFNNEKKRDRELSKVFNSVRKALKKYKNVSVILNENLMTADLAKRLGVKFIVRAARDKIDYQYELELAAGNQKLNPELETVLIIPSYKNINYKSRLLKQQTNN